MKVVVGGGSGFVGRALVLSLLEDGHDVAVASRRPSRHNGPGRTIGWEAVGREVDGADAVVNLAGVSIGGPRWTRGRKQVILASRVDTTRAIVRAIEAAKERPGVFVTASGIGYFGDSGDDIVDEGSPQGDSFLARVCGEWEAAGAAAPIRHVAVRSSLVLGPGAPALRLMALPFRLFAGGPIGDGRQWFPWVHLDDIVRVYRRAIDDESLEGAVNAVAPEQLRQRDAARAFGSVLHRPSILPAPAFAVRLGLGEQADLLLEGQRAVTRKLDGLEFRYRGLRAALEDALL
ncbi:MAG TPA: TIGR01777 family oxidoreductase [Gaiellaceae bacterium]